MLPACVVIAGVATFSGISGAALLTPLFLIGFPRMGVARLTNHSRGDWKVAFSRDLRLRNGRLSVHASYRSSSKIGTFEVGDVAKVKSKKSGTDVDVALSKNFSSPDGDQAWNVSALRDDEAKHVQFLRQALGSAAVKKPTINLDGAGFGYANQNDFLKLARIFEEGKRVPGSGSSYQQQGLFGRRRPYYGYRSTACRCLLITR